MIRPPPVNKEERIINAQNFNNSAFTAPGSKSFGIPRILISAASSGTGKTSITLGLIRALWDMGIRPAPFKTGPDYIDPGHLSRAAGRTCRNMDPLLMTAEGVKESFVRNSSGSDISVVEGVMGLFDGRPGPAPNGSTSDLAKLLKVPVIVILDSRASAQTVGAVALGMKLFDPECPVAGFIINRAGSERHYGMVKDSVEKSTGLPVFGWIPKVKDLEMPERHLGLVAAWEDEASEDSPVEKVIRGFAEIIRKNIDLDKLMESARKAPPLEDPGLVNVRKEDSPADGDNTPESLRNRVRIGVAMDNAFHFYYQDNLDFLESRGAELVEFSPVSDEKLPEGIKGLYFGGGYPELHAKALSRNTSMKEAILSASRKGMPIFGECGGLMYLCRNLETKSGTFPMTGIFNIDIGMRSSLSSLGYHNGTTLKETILGKAGMKMTGHVYRWSGITSETGTEEQFLELEKNGNSAPDGYVTGNTAASYLHIHFYGSPEAGENFVASCRNWKINNYRI